MSFNTIQITARGRALLARAQTGISIRFTRIKMGDGLIGSHIIDEMKDVISEKANLSITGLKVFAGGRAKVTAAYTNQGLTEGFYWRELAVFAEDPDNSSAEIMYCYGNAGALADFIPAEGSQILEKVISVLTIIGNASSVTAVIDSSNVYVTTQEFDELVTTVAAVQATADNAVSASIAAQNIANTNTENLKSYLSNYVRQPANGGITGGTATAYTCTSDPPPVSLVDKIGVVITVHTDSGANPTLNWNSIGPKPIKKPNGNAAVLKSGGIYTLRYNEETGNFILQGSDSSGNATPADLLAGKTASTDTGDITGIIPSKGAVTYSPSTAVQTIAAGQYLNGVQTIQPVTGTAKADNVDAGYTFSSGNGINLTGTSTKRKWAHGFSDVDVTVVSITGLGFRPSCIIIRCLVTVSSNAYEIVAEYCNGIFQNVATYSRINTATYSPAGDYSAYSTRIPIWTVTNDGFTFSVKNNSYTFFEYEYWAFE
ncbi:hypothetical protein EHE19_001635 [Ruminiclostridium herbifermentans]|uniref:BppU N-terminal domain-containing protein n=1 Tax=Ruminiclostridium herbifermentans TaxID=2488810 RepID=A0A4V6EN03_9FIRM|nr:hypothetical protein [Ruminiclostridium herbifermentans]QNU67273.1 hypothetical protein EHE19_001635 [Ruminiclostridium herbifermentans]